MAEKPELIIFSQNKMGGVQNFYYNILSSGPMHTFNARWIFLDSTEYNDPKLPSVYNCCEEVIFPLQTTPGESIHKVAARLDKLITGKEGAVLTNFDTELITLHLHRHDKKTVFFVCHDEGYLQRAQQFEFLIDVYIAHNIEFYERLQAMFPRRKEDVYFLPYGVKIPGYKRQPNTTGPLKIVMAARLQPEKGVADLPVIHRLLKEKGISVNWTIIGDGPEKQQLIKDLAQGEGAKFYTFAQNEEVVAEMAKNDIFILPSRLDGLPVAMLEAMSVGCVPVLSRFNTGIEQVVTKDIGYVLTTGDNKAFAETIALLHNNREELEKKSMLGMQLVREQYEASSRAKTYFDLLGRYKELKKKKRLKIPNYNGYLSSPWIPAPISKMIRKVKKQFS
jgi:glycosyltransferase involved in cell wall biosynthesis